MMELEQRIAALEAIVANLIRVGKVSSVAPGGMNARVIFEDQENTVSYDLQIVTKNSKANKEFWVPDVNEEVVCVFLPSGIESGFIIGSYYSALESVPESSQDVQATHFSDGTVVRYDRAAHELSVTVAGGNAIVQCVEATVKATASVTLDTPDTFCKGKLTVDGLLTYKNGIAGQNGTGSNTMQGGFNVTGGDVIADNISLKGHGHTEHGVGGRTSNSVV